MKAVVLCGGVPQVALLDYLKECGVETVLLDMNDKVPAVSHADKFYPVSVLDVQGVKDVAVRERADFVITVCADQVLQVVAQVSEELGLPCYIDFKTAQSVSQKSYMKRLFAENGIPSSKHVVMDGFSADEVKGLKYPLIVKPVDAYSSRGVKRVDDRAGLEQAFSEAKRISRTGAVIVEEFVVGDELTVDAWIQDGVAHVLGISNLDKIGEDGKFIINRTRFPAQISEEVARRIEDAAQRIATAFGLKNSPMLIQLITDGRNISVVEFCARTGGGDKFRLIEKISGFDVVKAVADMAMGKCARYEPVSMPQRYITNEFLYCRDGVLDRIEGLDELLDGGVITEYYVLKPAGHRFEGIRGSGDRVAYYTIETDTPEEMTIRRAHANAVVKVISKDGEDILRHDLIAKGQVEL